MIQTSLIQNARIDVQFLTIVPVLVGAPIISMIAMLLAMTSVQLKQTHSATPLFVTILLLATLPMDLPLRSLLPPAHTDVHFGLIVLAMVIVANTMIVMSLLITRLKMCSSQIVMGHTTMGTPKTAHLGVQSKGFAEPLRNALRCSTVD